MVEAESLIGREQGLILTERRGHQTGYWLCIAFMAYGGFLKPVRLIEYWRHYFSFRDNQYLYMDISRCLLSLDCTDPFTATLGQRRNRWRRFFKFWYQQRPRNGAKLSVSERVFFMRIIYFPSLLRNKKRCSPLRGGRGNRQPLPCSPKFSL